MTTDLWARVRQLFGERRPSPSQELEQILAGWRAEALIRNSGAPVKRERLHPLKGWVPDSPERAADGVNPQRKIRHPAHDRTRSR